MKNKLFILFFISALSAPSANAQIQNTVPDKKVSAPGNVPPKIFRVLSVSLVIDSSIRHSGNQGTDVYTTETYTYVGTGVVNYTNYETTQSAATRQYVNGIQTTTVPGTITLNGNGTEVVHKKRGAFHAIHTLKIVTDTPNQVTSNVITY